MRTTLLFLSLAALIALGSGCRPKDSEPLTYEQAQSALIEARMETSAMSMTTEIVEITTSFTIGQGIEKSLEELAAALQSQVPCSAITLDLPQLTLTWDFGTLADNCVYRGQTFAGVATISVTANSEALVRVEHTWSGLTNGIITIHGGAAVEWSAADLTRSVEHQLTWTLGERTSTSSGQCLQALIDPAAGIAFGVRSSGARQWGGDEGTWTLLIEDVEWRPSDPVPQSGSYKLVPPAFGSLELAFDRIDEDTIRVTALAGDRSFEFDVTSVSTAPAS